MVSRSRKSPRRNSDLAARTIKSPRPNPAVEPGCRGSGRYRSDRGDHDQHPAGWNPPSRRSSSAFAGGSSGSQPRWLIPAPARSEGSRGPGRGAQRSGGDPYSRANFRSDRHFRGALSAKHTQGCLKTRWRPGTGLILSGGGARAAYQALKYGCLGLTPLPG